MTNLEKQYIEKLKELIVEFELIHFATLSNTPRSCALVAKLKSEAFLLEQQIEQENIKIKYGITDDDIEAAIKIYVKSKQVEQEEKTVNDEFCDLCEQIMVPKNREVIDYLCMNPECDNYIKLNK